MTIAYYTQNSNPKGNSMSGWKKLRTKLDLINEAGKFANAKIMFLNECYCCSVK